MSRKYLEIPSDQFTGSYNFTSRTQRVNNIQPKQITIPKIAASPYFKLEGGVILERTKLTLVGH